MTNPVEKRVQLSGYTGVKVGVVSTPNYTTFSMNPTSVTISSKSDSYLNTGLVLGGEANYKGTFARAEVGLGTAYSGKVEIGHSFDIGRNMGLELSAKGEASKAIIGSNEIGIGTQNSYSSETLNVQQGAEVKTEWKSGVARLGARAKFTFGSKKANFGVGFESGIAKSTVPNTGLKAESVIYAEQQPASGAVAETCIHSIAETNIHNSTKYYGTPTVSADIKLSKKLSFNANADLNQAQAGVRWNF